MKKFITLLSVCVATIILISCTRKADEFRAEEVPVGSHVFSTLEIATILATNKLNWNITLTDAQYVAPKAEWVRDEYSKRLSKFLFDYNLLQWASESSDCDDISRAAATFGSMLFHNSKNRVKGAGLLFGEFHYVKKGVGGHAINVILVEDKGVYRLMYYEPQRRYEVERKESEPVMWVRF